MQKRKEMKKNASYLKQQTFVVTTSQAMLQHQT